MLILLERKHRVLMREHTKWGFRPDFVFMWSRRAPMIPITHLSVIKIKMVSLSRNTVTHGEQQESWGTLQDPLCEAGQVSSLGLHKGDQATREHLGHGLQEGYRIILSKHTLHTKSYLIHLFSLCLRILRLTEIRLVVSGQIVVWSLCGCAHQDYRPRSRIDWRQSGSLQRCPSSGTQYCLIFNW